MKTKAPVNTEKEIAFNKHILPNSFCAFFGFVVASFGVWADEIGFIILGVLLALSFVGIILVSPVYYVFSSENVAICHPFKRREIICWEDIRSIDKYGSWFYSKLDGYTHYKIYYRHEKEVLFLDGEICRSRKTKRLLQKYYKGNVE